MNIVFCQLINLKTYIHVLCLFSVGILQYLQMLQLLALHPSHRPQRHLLFLPE